MTRATRRNRRILLVEDDPAVGETFERMLRVGGYETVWAQDASAALTAIVDTAPAAVLVDLRLPRTNGLELIRRIRERETNGRRTPIALITGDYFLGDTVCSNLQELQAELYFKPLWLNDLLQILDKLLDVK